MREPAGVAGVAAIELSGEGAHRTGTVVLFAPGTHCAS
jgi:hypothetical protein